MICRQPRVCARANLWFLPFNFRSTTTNTAYVSENELKKGKSAEIPNCPRADNKMETYIAENEQKRNSKFETGLEVYKRQKNENIISLSSSDISQLLHPSNYFS